MNACLQASALGDMSSLSEGAATRCRMSRRGAGTLVNENDAGADEDEDEAARKAEAMVCVS